MKPVKIDEKKLIRYTRRKEFTEQVIKIFIKKFNIKLR